VGPCAPEETWAADFFELGDSFLDFFIGPNIP
jgi:hypothetical protein